MKKTVFALFILLIVVIALFTYFFSNKLLWFQQRNTSNSWIMDKPTIEDEKPKENFGRSQWWAWYGYAYTKNKTSTLLLNANIYPRDGTLYGNAYTLDGIIETFNFNMDISWDEETKTLYGTMKREKDNATGTWSLKFPADGYRLYEQRILNEVFTLRMWSRGVPLWGARYENQMLQVGWSQGEPVFGGGFHDCVIVQANLTRGKETWIFDGFGMYARAWLSEIIGKGEAVVGFINQQPEFYINFMYVRNPYNLDEIFVKQGRIGFSDVAYRFDNFIYSGDKWPSLQWFELDGTYKDGKVHLVGENIGFLHDRQKHPLIHWTGTITRNGETISVDSLGSGEFRQIE